MHLNLPPKSNQRALLYASLASFVFNTNFQFVCPSMQFRLPFHSSIVAWTSFRSCFTVRALAASTGPPSASAPSLANASAFHHKGVFFRHGLMFFLCVVRLGMLYIQVPCVSPHPAGNFTSLSKNRHVVALDRCSHLLFSTTIKNAHVIRVDCS